MSSIALKLVERVHDKLYNGINRQHAIIISFLMHPFCSCPSYDSYPPLPSPLSSTPGDLILEFAKALDSQQDLLNLALTARSLTARSSLDDPNVPSAVELYLFMCITCAVRICIPQHH